MIAIDLFSGAGGLAEGFTLEGFQVAAHIEKEKWMCETLKTRAIYNFLKKDGNLQLYFKYLEKNLSYRNFEEGRKTMFNKYIGLEKLVSDAIICKAFGNPELESETSDINEIITDIENALRNINATSVDVVIGGPPCQAFSVLARHIQNKSKDYIKINLYAYYLMILKHFMPKTFVFENVPGITSILQGYLFKQICAEFNKAGYKLLCKDGGTIEENVFNASDFGVCQTRKRIILIGVRNDKNADFPDFNKYKIYNFSDLTTRTAIEDLPSMRAGENEDHILYPYKDKKNLTEFQKLMRINSCGVINHKARPNIKRDLDIYRLFILKKVSRYKDLPEELKNHKNQTAFEDRYRVHYWDKIPHTIVAHISKDGHYNIHPDIKQCRSLTVREAARIQSFPDNYKFEGPRTSQYIQVGNAVPPLMAQTIARSIKNILKPEDK